MPIAGSPATRCILSGLRLISSAGFLLWVFVDMTLKSSTIPYHYVSNPLVYGLIAIMLLGGCRPSETVKRHDFEIQGIDVSHHQGEIDWPRLAEQPIHFVYIKATEGGDHKDRLYQANWDQALAVGIKRGAYHFFRPGTPVLYQVLNFIRTVKLEEGDLPPVVDIEVRDGVMPDKLIESVRTWLLWIEAFYGMRPIIYSNQDFFNDYLAGHFPDHKCWIARYSESEPCIDAPKDWDFWQYGNRGRLEGVAGFVDFNVFRGDRHAFENLQRPAMKKGSIAIATDP
jgi:lysozyme